MPGKASSTEWNYLTPLAPYRTGLTSIDNWSDAVATFLALPSLVIPDNRIARNNLFFQFVRFDDDANLAVSFAATITGTLLLVRSMSDVSGIMSSSKNLVVTAGSGVVQLPPPWVVAQYQSVDLRSPLVQFSNVLPGTYKLVVTDGVPAGGVLDILYAVTK